MRPLPLEEFVSEIAACPSADQVFAAFRREALAEGFQNVVFCRYMPSGEHEVPFIDLPEDFPRVYLGENFFESDPVLASLKLRTRPFSWADMMQDHDWDKQARDIVGACSELGARDGMTIPFHTPGGRCDFFSLSFREKRTIDPRRLTVINMKSYATWQRFNEFEYPRLPQLNTFNTTAHKSRETLSPPTGAHHAKAGVDISAAECRAIVATDIAHKRYRAGLTEFNATLPKFLGKRMLESLVRRGLIYEEPDDDYWRFVFRPSAIARAHLNSCPAVPYHREEVSSRHVRRDERPSLV